MTEREQHNGTEGQSRYRTLLEISTTVATQPSVDAVLRSLVELLSNLVRFDLITLLLFDKDQQILRLRTQIWNRCNPPELAVGTEIPYRGTAIGRAIEEQEVVFVSDIQEVYRTPQLNSRYNPAGLQSGYILPISTPRKKLGVLTFATIEKGKFSPDDAELMRSVAEHLSIALESAMATDNAELYQRELARERDRLGLLLEINNHIVTKLDVNALFCAAGASIREHFANDFSSFWLFDEPSNRLRCVLMDFPGKSDFLREMGVAEVSQESLGKFGARRPSISSITELSKTYPAFADALKAESIATIVGVPLVTRTGPIGAMILGSKRENNFGETDLHLLEQIGDQIGLVLDNALAYGRLSASRDRLEEERVYLESEIKSEYNFQDIIGKSETLLKVLRQVSIVAPTDSTVLLHGETGTGKELIARAIHNLSSRRSRTFVRLNCAAIPSGLVESELFGHEKGAFTGALTQKRGRFELADGGSLFLDEIGDIALDLQPKLLRAVQEQEFERLGSAKTIRVDVRVISATHRDLSAMIREGHFREDLFYRLNVFPIEIPPLRERREDIPLLVHYFVTRLARRMRKTIKVIPKLAMAALVNNPWRGNIRELENFIERTVILSQGEELQVPVSELKTDSSSPINTATTFEQAERDTILKALKSASGKISGHGGAAERLGLKRTTLQNKMKRLGISKQNHQPRQTHDTTQRSL
jgi:formate hydrogenlyase transcriptional activator